MSTSMYKVLLDFPKFARFMALYTTKRSNNKFTCT